MTPPRVVLRDLRADDAETMYAYRSDAEVARYQSWEPASLATVRAFIAEMGRDDPFRPGVWHQLAIVRVADGRIIGDCGVHVPETEPRSAEFGITLAAAAQGHGFATEALRQLLALVFARPGMHRVFCSVDPRNVRSVALMRRTGLRCEAHHRESLWFKGAWADDLVFAMLRGEWQAREDEAARASPES